MKLNPKKHGSRMTQTALLLCALLCAQNIMACWTVFDEPCADYFSTGNCSGESPSYQFAYSSGASYHAVCVDAGNHTNQTAERCQPQSNYPCTWTLVLVLCDGSQMDVPMNTSTDYAILFGSCIS